MKNAAKYNQICNIYPMHLPHSYIEIWMNWLIHGLLAMLLFTTAGAAIAADQRQLIFENSSAHDVKIVAPGSAFILKAGSMEKEMTFQADDPLGVHLNIWWKHNPLELCQVFTPWARKVLISGKSTIACLSRNL